jgi:hypothetical protein
MAAGNTSPSKGMSWGRTTGSLRVDINPDAPLTKKFGVGSATQIIRRCPFWSDLSGLGVLESKCKVALLVLLKPYEHLKWHL